MTNWESLIAERSRPAACMADTIAKEVHLKLERQRENTPERKAQHKTWAQSPAGKKSERERGKRYRATEKGKEACRRKSRRYFDRHKDDPEWRKHRLEVQKAWKAKKKAEKEFTTNEKE